MEGELVIIQAPGYTWALFVDTIKASPFAEKLEYIATMDNICVLSEGFLEILRKELDESELAVLLKAAIVLYLSNKPRLLFNAYRFEVLEKTLKYSTCVDPIFIHNILEHIIDTLYTNDTGSLLNFLKLSLAISGIYRMGRIFAVCLCWFIIGVVTGNKKEITMYRYRPLSELLEFQPNIKKITEQKNWRELYLYIRASILLLELSYFQRNSTLRDDGYPDPFFLFTVVEATQYHQFLWSLHATLDGKNVEGGDQHYVDLLITMKRYLANDLVGAAVEHLRISTQVLTASLPAKGT